MGADGQPDMLKYLLSEAHRLRTAGQPFDATALLEGAIATHSAEEVPLLHCLVDRYADADRPREAAMAALRASAARTDDGMPLWGMAMLKKAQRFACRSRDPEVMELVDRCFRGLLPAPPRGRVERGQR